MKSLQNPIHTPLLQYFSTDFPWILTHSLSLSIDCTLPRTLHIPGSLQVKNWKLIYHDENCQHPKLRAQYLYRIYTTHVPTISHGKYHHIYTEFLYYGVFLESCFGYCFLEVIESIQTIQYWFVMSARTHVDRWYIYIYNINFTLHCITLHIHLRLRHLHLLHLHVHLHLHYIYIYICTYIYCMYILHVHLHLHFDMHLRLLHLHLHLNHLHYIALYIYMCVCVCVCILFITWYYLVFSSSRLVSFLSYITALGGSQCCPCLLPLLLSCFHTPEPQRMHSLQVRQNTSPKRSAKILLLQRRFHIQISVQFLVLRTKNNPDGITISPRWIFFEWQPRHHRRVWNDALAAKLSVIAA